MFSQYVNEYINEILSLEHFVDSISSHILQDAESYRTQNDRSLLMQAYFIAELRLKNEELSEGDKEKCANIVTSSRVSLTKYYGVTDSELKKVNESMDSPDFLISLGKILYWNKMRDMESELYKVTFINLVIVTEKFVSRIFKEFILKSPKLFSKETMKFSIADLAEYETINQLRDYAAIVKTEEILRGNLDAWIQFLSSNTVPINNLSAIYNRVFELFQRRNLLVHNDGVINSIYISKVKQETPYKIGDRLKMDIDYLHSALSLLEEYFICIAFEIWYKLQRKNISREKAMISIISKLILSKHYVSTVNICEYCKDKMFLDNDQKLIWEIHKYTALKNTNRLQEEDYDVIRSICNGKSNSIYELAQFILLDNENEAINLFIKLYKDSIISLYDYFTWPILQKLHDYPNFRDALNNNNNEKLKKACMYIYSGLQEYDSNIISLLFASDI